MSAIVSLLRVMTYRDAEAITLEARMLEDFVMPLVEGKQLEQGPVMVVFTDADGTTYPVTIERGPGGIRAVVKKPAPPKKVAPAPAASPPPPPPPSSPSV